MLGEDVVSWYPMCLSAKLMVFPKGAQQCILAPLYTYQEKAAALSTYIYTCLAVGVKLDNMATQVIYTRLKQRRQHFKGHLNL